MTDAKRRADRKYSDKSYDRVAIRVHKGERSRWHDAAAARGVSLAAFIVTAVTEYIEMHPPDGVSAGAPPCSGVDDNAD